MWKFFSRKNYQIQKTKKTNDTAWNIENKSFNNDKY